MKINKGFISILFLLPGVLHADINITRGLTSFEVEHGDQTIEVKRIQTPEAVISGNYARINRPCPPFCVQPMEAAPGVKTIGIYELVNFMQTEYAVGEGILVDARPPDTYEMGTIPGSINIPYTRIARRAGANDIEILDAMEKFGVKEQDDRGWDFSEAAQLILWCNGNWCGLSPAAIRGLLAEGYPPEKLRYFRGGMEDWIQYGMPVVKGD